MGQKVIFDWFTCSSKIHSVENWMEDLGMTNTEFTLSSGRNGYSKGFSAGGVSIWFEGLRGEPDEHGQSPMGTCCNMSGQGCRKFETDGNGDFYSLFQQILSEPEDMHITRLDIAFDDMEGLLPLDMIAWDSKPKNNACVSKFQYWEVLESAKGLTVQHGSDSSDVLLRIYDKALERGYTDGRHWVRCEIQLRHDAALGAIRRLVAGTDVGEVYSGILRNYIRFVEDDNDDRYRATTKPYWERFLNAAAGIRVVDKPGLDYNALALEDYIIGQAGNSIWTYIKIFGVEKLVDKLKEKNKKLNENQRRLLKDLGDNFQI